MITLFVLSEGWAYFGAAEAAPPFAVFKGWAHGDATVGSLPITNPPEDTSPRQCA